MPVKKREWKRRALAAEASLRTVVVAVQVEGMGGSSMFAVRRGEQRQFELPRVMCPEPCIVRVSVN